jgi:hypothetical protein
VKPFYMGEERRKIAAYLGYAPNLSIRHRARHQDNRFLLPWRIVMTKANRDRVIIEYQLRFLEGPRDLCVTDGLDEVRKVKIVIEPIEKRYLDGANRRSVNLSDEVLEVLASAAEPQKGEAGKNHTCRWRYVYLTRARRWGFESNVKGFKLAQYGQWRGHRFGINVTGIGYVEFNINEVVAGQKKFR